MRQDLMDILACPMCKGDLQLTIDEQDGDEITRGSLFCAKCNERYPIEDGIPNLLPAPTVPEITFGKVRALLGPALVIAILAVWAFFLPIDTAKMAVPRNLGHYRCADDWKDLFSDFVHAAQLVL